MIGTSIAIGSTVGGYQFGPAVFKSLCVQRLRRRCGKTANLVLSYDDGPGRCLTPAVVEVLRAANAKATFFLLGRRAVQAPDAIDALAAAGHELGCHSHQHRNAWKCWPWQGVADIQAGYRTLSPWIRPDAIFRPPYGKMTLATWLAVRARGSPIGWWTIDSGDTHAVLPDPASVVERVRREGGGVVLMHDFDRDPPNTEVRAAYVLEVTRRLLDLAAREGLTIRPLGELLKMTHGQAG